MTVTSRRSFLQQATGGLVIAMVLPTMARGQAIRRMTPADVRALPAAPNAFLRIAENDTVTVIAKHIEFGQGAFTGLATLAAEELDADWSQIRVEAAPADLALYANYNMGMQGTGGSSAMFNSYYQMRKAGAAARTMLVAAAAAEWRVPPGEITVAKGIISHAASSRKSGFGAFAAAAAKMPAPADPPLKDPANFRLIGSDLKQINGTAKSTGAAKYTINVKRPGMVHSGILHPPAFGATLKSIDSAAAEAIDGVLGVKQVPQGVAVYAKSTWAAQRGVAALNVEWDSSKAELRSCEALYAAYAAAAKTPGDEAELRGQGASALAGAAKQIEAEYRFPFLAHAPMEPGNAVVEIGDGRADLWMGSQLVTLDQRIVAQTLGLKPDQVVIHQMTAGGSFGRLGTPNSEFAAEAAAVAKAWGKGPVKHLWTRENDIRGGLYRPLAVHRLRGGIDAAGNIVAWDQVVAIQSFLRGSAMDPTSQIKIDNSAVEGARGMSYAIPNLRIGQHLMSNGVPASFWRSVGSSHTGFAVESFLDELLELGGKDPVKGRLDLIREDEPRLKAVLSRVAEMAKWSGPGPRTGRAYGVAALKCFRSYIAQIAEVSRGEDGLPRVHKVWCAIDCGVAINPDVISAQIEGGIGFALGAALYGEITLGADGRPEQGNFDDYRPLRMPEMPAVEVAIVKSAADPTGVGEPGVPPLAPAVANAFRRLSGKSIRTLPFAKEVLA
ncbi:MAG: molybdopterin cofactor-binding domain-containing protein [Novosphingobium sp.]